MARDDYFRRRAGEERHLRDLNEAIHPTAAAFENLTTNFSFGSRTTAVFDEFNERIAKASKSIEATLENLGTVFKATGVQIKDASQGYWSYLKGTNFGRSFGLKPEGGGGIEEFAGAFGRFLASRSISGPANYFFESAKNPLHDNFEVNRAQQTSNSAINALATTGSVTHALIAGITSWATANLMHDREIKTANYNFAQRSLDTQRGAAEQGSDWAFQKILGMYSRGEQIRMYSERAKVRRGELEYDKEGIEAQAKAARQPQETTSAQPQATPAQPAAAGGGAAAGQPAAGQGAAQPTQPFQVPGLPTNLLGSQAVAALNEPEPVSPLASPEVEQKAEAARKAAEDAGVKAAESRKEAAEEDKKASEKRKSSVSKEIEELAKREKSLQAELEAHDKKYAGGELSGEEIQRAEFLENRANKTKSQIAAREKAAREGKLYGKKTIRFEDGTTKEITEQDYWRKKGHEADDQLARAAELRAAPNEKRGALVNELADVQEQKQALEAQEKQELDAEEKKKRRENEARERRREWRRQRNLDPDTGASLVKPEPETKTLGESNGAVNAAAEKVKGAEKSATGGKGAEDGAAAATTEKVEESAKKTQEAIKKAAESAPTVVNHPLPVKPREQTYEQKSMSKLVGDVEDQLNNGPSSLLEADRMGYKNLTEYQKKLIHAKQAIRNHVGKDNGERLTIEDAYDFMRNGSNNTGGVDALKGTVLNSQIQEWIKDKDDRIIKSVRSGSFTGKNMAEIKEALDAANRQDINFDKDANFKKLRDIYQTQERQAAMEELEAKKLKADPNQIMSQYTDASRTTDAMARQGFFIGSQVDVQDVNKDILAEVKKMVPMLSKMAAENVGSSEGYFLTRSTFK